jgi:hypothetical protein
MVRTEAATMNILDTAHLEPPYTPEEQDYKQKSIKRKNKTKPKQQVSTNPGRTCFTALKDVFEAYGHMRE